MRLTKTLILAAMASLCSVGMKAQTDATSSAEAQELGYKPYPYWFVQVQGGVNKVFSPQSKFNPTFSLGVGRMFSPIIGARLHFNGYETKNGFTSIPETYKFKYITSDADVLVNILNIFDKKVHRALDLYFVGGLGLSYAWDNKSFGALNPTEDISNAWGPAETPRKSLLSHNLRAGLMLDGNIAKNWSIGAEVDVNSLDDRFNSKYKNSDDWMLTAQLSVTYKFGFQKYEKPIEPVTTANAYDQAAAEAEAARAAAAKARADELARAEAARKAAQAVEEPLKETAHFQIRESDPNGNAILDKVVAWCNKYPNKGITISGYADKGTGNPTINMKYSRQRAQRVADALKKKGIAASRMTVNAYGDTVQPFPNDNDANRCTIVVGE